MSDLQKHIVERKKKDPEFTKNYNNGFEDFKLGVMLKQARKEAGLTQEELAERIHTKKSAISRIENHSGDIKFSTLEKIASALGKHLKVTFADI
ncbi:MAG: helix-turn-helix domain-containing protein [Candidatus Cloacimonetes bacterium]|nr:helix-turn-helix domain-containing protein [Candidatus Cloacimonadota bacterium]